MEPFWLGRTIYRLAESGFVERRPDPSDRRAWRIYLTDNSRPILADLRALADELLEQALDGLSAQEKDQLAASLQRIRGNLETLEDDNGSVVAHG